MSSPALSKRQTIIQAATELFIEHNFNAVSMDKIAQAAPVSKATLYKYFDSKHALLVAVVEELCQAVSQTMDESLPTEIDGIDSYLKQVALSFMDLIYSKEGLAIHRLIIAECHAFPELGELIYQAGPQNLFTQLENYLQSLNNMDEFNMSDTAFVAKAFFGLLTGDLHLQCLLNIKSLPSTAEKQAYINKTVPFYIQGFFHDAI